MDPDILVRARSELRRRGAASAVLSDPSSVTWLTGYAPPAETGPSPFDAPPIAWLDPDALVLIVSETEAPGAAASGLDVRTYPGYTIDRPLAPVTLAGEAFASLLAEVLPRGGAVGCEADTLPLRLARIGEERGVRWSPIDGWASSLRAVKTPGELAKIRAALALCDLAQESARALVRPGLSETALFEEVRARVETAAGGRTPIFADFIAGRRTVEIGGPPGALEIAPNDPVLVDWVLRLGGYWGDTCNVYVAGSPSPELRRLYGVVREALEAAIGAVRPGATAADVDRAARSALERFGYGDYPHHTGHGIGVAYHEEPRIVAYNTMPLEPGMVIALEPGVYLPGVGGVRLEDSVLVTAGGCEVLTRHRKSLE
jgi:Xaa-Pro aminopeptidase